MTTLATTMRRSVERLVVLPACASALDSFEGPSGVRAAKGYQGIWDATPQHNAKTPTGAASS